MSTWLDINVLTNYKIIENLNVTNEKQILNIDFPKIIDTENYEYLYFTSIKSWDYKEVELDIRDYYGNSYDYLAGELTVELTPENNAHNIKIEISGAENMINTIVDVFIFEQRK